MKTKVSFHNFYLFIEKKRKEKKRERKQDKKFFFNSFLLFILSLHKQTSYLKKQNQSFDTKGEEVNLVDHPTPIKNS
jgi:hypothetical protein